MGRGPEAGAHTQGDVRTLLREAGMRVTTPRRVVLEVLAELPHATVAQLAPAVRDRLRWVSLQTIYDVLAAGVRAGLVRRFDSTGAAARFEIRRGDHHHLVCRECGRTDAIPGAPHLVANHTGYLIEEIVYRGLCPLCRAPGAPHNG